jgi:hypothetical protein
MPTLPADEDYARALLSIFGARRLLPMQSLRQGDVKATFLAQNMGREFDFDAALDYAISRGWLRAGFGSIRLTTPGDEEVQTIWPGRGLRNDPPRRPQSPPPSGKPLKSDV